MPTVDAKIVGKGLLQQPVKRVNDVTKLLKLAADSDEVQCRAAVHYLKLFFLGAFERKEVGLNPTQHSAAKPADPQAKLAQWLQQKFDVYLTQLHGLLQSQQSAELQVFALSALLELVRGQQTGTFSQAQFASTATILLGSKAVGDDTLAAFQSRYLAFADVRFYTLRAIQKVSQEGAMTTTIPASDTLTKEELGERLFMVLTAVPAALQEATEEGAAVPSWCGATEAGVVGVASDRSEGSQQRRKRKREQQGEAAAPLLGGVQWANPSAYKRAFSDAWLGLLQLPLPTQLLKQVLVQLHTRVMPALPNPLLLADFLTCCLDQGGMLGILALNGIFTLVTKHGLEYPAFYARLYALLQGQAEFAKLHVQAPVFRAKYRARFLQLADIFLSSGMVPAYTAAAFIKKFARLALTAPPAGAIIAIAFIHNLLRRHPSCSVLVHRPTSYRDPKAQPVSVAQNTVQSAPRSLGRAALNGNVTATAQNGIVPHPSGTALAAPNPHAQQNGVPSYAMSSSSDDDDNNDNPSSEDATAATVAAAAEDSNTGRQASEGGEAESVVGEDVYDEAQLDPAKSRAIESSLWEIESLRQHYYHTVATYVSILDRDLGDRKKTAEVDVTALLKSSYSSLMALETEKRLKSVPVAFYPRPPQQLFPEVCKIDYPGWVL